MEYRVSIRCIRLNGARLGPGELCWSDAQLAEPRPFARVFLQSLRCAPYGSTVELQLTDGRSVALVVKEVLESTMRSAVQRGVWGEMSCEALRALMPTIRNAPARQPLYA